MLQVSGLSVCSFLFLFQPLSLLLPLLPPFSKALIKWRAWMTTYFYILQNLPHTSTIFNRYWLHESIFKDFSFPVSIFATEPFVLSGTLSTTVLLPHSHICQVSLEEPKVMSLLSLCPLFRRKGELCGWRGVGVRSGSSGLRNWLMWQGRGCQAQEVRGFRRVWWGPALSEDQHHLQPPSPLRTVS